MAESDPSRLEGFETNQWYVLVGPAKLPPAILRRFNSETNKALTVPDARAKLEKQGLEIEGSTPEATQVFIRRELAKWAKVVVLTETQREAVR